MATPTLTISNINAPAPWGAVGDELKVNLTNANQSAPTVVFTLKWNAPSAPDSEAVNAIYFGFNAKWSGFVSTRTLSMTAGGQPPHTGPNAGPFVLSPSSSQQYRQFQLAWSPAIFTVGDLRTTGLTVSLTGTTGPQQGGAESAADWSLFFSSMLAQGFTGADHGTTPPPVVNQRFISGGATYNLLTNQSQSPGPPVNLSIQGVSSTTPIAFEGVSWTIPTVGGVQPATVGGFTAINTSTDINGNTTAPAVQVSATFTGTFQMIAQAFSNPQNYGNSPARFTYNVWPIPAGGAGTPIFTITSGAGHWCVAGVPDVLPVVFAASPGYNVSVAFGSFVNISSVAWVNAANAASQTPTTQVTSSGAWSTDNYPPPIGPTYMRPNYSGAPNTGSFVATFTIRSPDNLTVCGTIAVTINVAKTSAFLPIQNFNALQLFAEV